MSTPTQALPPKTVYVTRTGLPVSFKFDWPFRRATSGADFDVLHAEITLENSENLRALVALNLSATLREVLPSLDRKDTEGPVINALRKDIDTKQIEFLKSAKLVPLPFSSRNYDFKRNQWIFGKASDEEIGRLIEQKVYWRRRRLAGGRDRGALRSDQHRSHRRDRVHSCTAEPVYDGSPLRHRVASADESTRTLRKRDGRRTTATGRKARL